MELTQLIQFRTIAECSTMTQAAEKLNISQPALSTTLRKLEEELGVLLFDRKKNRITLNPAGKLALAHVNNILDRVTQMKDELHQYSHRDKIFYIAFCDPGPLWYCVPRFSMMYPNFDVKSSLFDENDDGLNLLLNQTSDIVISSEQLIHPDIISNSFINEQLLLSVPVSNALSTRTTLSFHELKLQKIVLMDVGGSFFQKQQAFWEKSVPDLKLTIYKDYFMFNHMVVNSDVLTISTRLVQHYRDDGPNRVLIPLTDTELSINYHISYLKKNRDRLTPFLSWAEFCTKDFANE
jgi:DNA-binding transcriptional LysR family regulator